MPFIKINQDKMVITTTQENFHILWLSTSKIPIIKSIIPKINCKPVLSNIVVIAGISLFTLTNRDEQSISKNKPIALAKNIDLFTLNTSYIVQEMKLIHIYNISIGFKPGWL